MQDPGGATKVAMTAQSEDKLGDETRTVLSAPVVQGGERSWPRCWRRIPCCSIVLNIALDSY